MVAEVRIAALETENAQLRDQNAQLRELVAELQLLIEQLNAKVEKLQDELGRHSGNSSRPPSSDTLAQRAAQNARRAEWKKKPKRRPGKQPGAQGKHLAQVADPDEVVRHIPDFCSSCGAELDRATLVGVERRQVFDLPDPRLVVTEHIGERLGCSCGAATTATFPASAAAPASWGPRVRAAATYLLVRQHLPVERTAELLDDMLGAPVSTGWLAGLPAEAKRGLTGFLGDARIKLADAPVLHVDETGARIDGSRQWLHVASTELLTLVDCHAKRGVQATDDMGVLPGFKGVAVHDRWRPYWRYEDCTHAICGAHLLRDLAGVAETPSQRPWAEAMAKTLLAAKQAADTAREAGQPQISASLRIQLGQRYAQVVDEGHAANPAPVPGRRRTTLERQGYNLAVALRDHKDEVLRFIDNLGVSFDNNQAERDLRMAKLQQKISGCFRTEEGAKSFCAVRSYLSTASKHGVHALDVLARLFAGDPWRIPSEAPT